LASENAVDLNLPFQCIFGGQGKLERIEKRGAFCHQIWLVEMNLNESFHVGK
jgi:hypothetical protein